MIESSLDRAAQQSATAQHASRARAAQTYDVAGTAAGRKHGQDAGAAADVKDALATYQVLGCAAGRPLYASVLICNATDTGKYSLECHALR